MNSDPASAPPIAVVYKPAELLEKENALSAVGIQLEGENVVYGSENVLEKIVNAFPAVLHGKKVDLVYLCLSHIRG